MDDSSLEDMYIGQENFSINISKYSPIDPEFNMLFAEGNQQ